ncbi:MAG: type II toxin-antitoxin system HicB family antitoxin [Polyangiaceae bacterium]
MKLPVHVQTRQDGVRAFCPDLPGCSASARTEQEALRRLKTRIEECFTTSAQVTAAPGTRIVQIEV